MESTRWEHHRESLRAYRRRTPEESVLYRIVYHCRDELEFLWEERFQAEYGVLRDVVTESIDKYLDCGILIHGAALCVCENRKCDHSFLVAFSCKRRAICPSCSAKRAFIFSENLHANVLSDVPIAHIVWSIPKRLRIYFRFDRSLFDILYTAAWESLTETFAFMIPGTPGAVISAQPAGESLNFNPHLHSLVSCGTFLDDGAFKITELNFASTLEKLFTEKVLAALKEKELIDQAVIDQLYSQSHTGFSVWIGEPVAPSDIEQRLFLGRYIDRCPLSLEKLSICDDIVTYTTKDGRAHEFTPVEFLARLSQHIPDKWEQQIRFYGAYSARTRGAKRLHDIALGIQPLEHFEQKKPSKSWAALIKRIFELDPLLCPKCGSKMQIKAFITDSNEIQRYMRKHNIPDYRAPPKITSSIPQVQLVLDADLN